MIGQLAGMALGTGLNMYGADKKSHALRGASRDYLNRLNQLQRDHRAAALDAQMGYSAIGDQHRADLSTGVGNYLGADAAANTNPFAASLASTATQAANAAPTAGSWAQTGGAQSGVQSAVAEKNAGALGRSIEAARGGERQRQIGAGRHAATNQYDLTEAMRGNQMADLGQTMALRNAGIDQNFQIDQNALQTRLDNAGKAGDDQMMWGNLLSQGSGIASNMDSYGAQQEAQRGAQQQAFQQALQQYMAQQQAPNYGPGY